MLLAALMLVPTLAAGAAGEGSVRPTEAVATPEASRPQLLLIHGGAFVADDPTFQPLTVAAAIEAGFEAHYLNYPLDDMPAATRAARAEARRLRARYGPENVYAYGSSAGGTLATLLSGEGLVQAAVAKAPVSDLVGWEWPLGRYGAGYFRQVHLGVSARYRLSPLRRPQERPLLLIQGREDGIVPPTMSEGFAAKFKRVHLWLVPGGHYTDRRRPYLITGAMRWLAAVAKQHSTTGSEPPLEPCARNSPESRGQPTGIGRSRSSACSPPS